MADLAPPPDRDDADAPAPAVNPLAVLGRRWPFLVAALVLGLGVGVLNHVTSKPAFQSGAEVLVVKKRTNISQLGDARSGELDDYVGAQVRIIQGESVRRAAARELKRASLKTRLPDDEEAVAGMVKAGLSVSKDAGAPGSIGSGIVLLGFRWDDPNDSKAFLDAVIRAYQGELSGVYEGATNDRLAVLVRAITENLKVAEKASADLLQKEDELRRITTEDVVSVRARVTAQKDRLYALELEQIQMTSQLDLIKGAAGADRRQRLAVLQQLTGATKSPVGASDQTTLEQTRRQLLQRKKVLEERVGPDHPDMKAVDVEIQYVTAELQELNPANPTGVVDELDAVGKQVNYRATTAELQITRLRDRLKKDEDALKDAGRFKSEADSLGAQIAAARGEVAKLEQDKRNTLITRDAGGYSATAITPPGVGGQVAPKLYQSLLLGLMLGGAGGVAAMAAAELRDKSFKSPAEIRRRLGVPVVGHIPEIRKELPPDADAPKGLHSGLVAATRPKSIEAEAYRGVRTQLYFSLQGRGHQVIQITSPNPGDGKSTLAANLAVSIAQSGKRAVLIDCDFRKPQVHKIFGIKEDVEVGLASVVAGKARRGQAMRRTDVPNLDLMPCGPRPDNPAELLTNPLFQELIDGLKADYDFVIVDTPPMLAVSDPTVVAPRVDGVLLVFRMTNTARPAAERAREQLAAIGANLLGVVVNGEQTSGQGYNGYNYGSNAGYRYVDYEYAERYADGAYIEDGVADTVRAKKA